MAWHGMDSRVHFSLGSFIFGMDVLDGGRVTNYMLGQVLWRDSIVIYD